MIEKTRLDRLQRQGETVLQTQQRKKFEKAERDRRAEAEQKLRIMQLTYHEYDIRKYADTDYSIPIRTRTRAPEDERIENYYF